MIPQAYITEWSQKVPWQSNEQVEQDLVICRALVEIFSDPWLAERLAFRGGTALHKLYLTPQLRYSEDIDLVQTTPEPFGPIVDRLRERLAFLGEPQRKAKEHNFTLYYRFDSEFPPSVGLRLKVETNTREHFTVLGLHPFSFELESSWYSASCDLITYKMEELLGTKLRALYQRKKGRDLFDLFMPTVRNIQIDSGALLESYRRYMGFSVKHPPSQKDFILNLDAKMRDPEFLGDTKALLRPEISYDPEEAYNYVKKELIEHI